MRKRVLFVHEKSGFFGGAEQHLFSTAEKLGDRYMLSFISSASSGNQETEFLAPFQQTFSIPGWEENRLRTALEEARPDLIFIHKCLSAEAMRVFVESGIPTVHMVHDHEEYCFKKSKYFPLSRRPCPCKSGVCCLFPGLGFIERTPSGSFSLRLKGFFSQRRLIAESKKCSALLAASRYMKETLEIQGYERISVLFGVPSIKAAPASRKRDGRGTVLYVGQIIRGKGLDHLIQALGEVKEPWNLTVIGSGPYEEHCKALSKRLGLDRRITFKGFVQRQELDRHFSRAAAGVVPSLWPEPFGMAGVEFLQYGIPVVGYDSGGISDWLVPNQTGKLVPAGRVDLLTSAIEEILQNPEMADSLGNQGKQFIAEKYHFDTYINELCALFEEKMG